MSAGIEVQEPRRTWIGEPKTADGLLAMSRFITRFDNGLPARPFRFALALTRLAAA